MAGEPFKLSEVPCSGVVLSGHSVGDPVFRKAVTRSGGRGLNSEDSASAEMKTRERSQGLPAVLGKRQLSQASLSPREGLPPADLPRTPSSA